MKLRIKEIIKKVYISKWFTLFLILIGSSIRIRQYIFNRSLWLDEAMLALNIIRHSYLDLLKPLDYIQTAPPLFLFIVNFLTEKFGYHEYVLRFLPLIAGIASLFLFWYLANKFLNKFVVPIAVGLLSFSSYAIYYSTEFKQYSVDLMVTIIILILSVHVYKKNFDLKSNLLLGILGALFICLSHTSVFILAGASLSLVLTVFLKERLKGIKKFGYILGMSLFWLISFAVNYLFIIRVIAPAQIEQEYWQSSYAPMPIISVSDLLWYPKTLLYILRNPLDLYFVGITLLVLFAGLVSFYNKKEKFFLFLVSLPFIFLIIASMLGAYPIIDRLVVFILPIFFLLISKGIEEFSLNLSGKNIIIIFLLIILIFFQPLAQSSKSLLVPRYKEETRPMIEYYQNNKAKEDKIYVYYSTVPAFLYYTRETKEGFIEGVRSREDQEKYLDELESLDGEGRIWFIFSHVHENEEEIYIKKLNELGKRLDYKSAYGSSIYLYDI